MNRARFDSLLLLLAGSAIFVALGVAWERVSAVSMVDFKCVYYAARCILEHSDPYNPTESLRVYQRDHGDRASDPAPIRRLVTLYVYLPSALVLTAPFALLPWGVAHLLWMALTAASFIFAAILMWDVGAEKAPVLSGALMGLLLAGSELLVEVGNPAGIAISLCAIAVWCFLKERWIAAGVICLAVSLAVKPHVSGPVWLFFLLAGRVHRKRALQTLLLTAAMSVPAIAWTTSVAPHWIREVRDNVAAAAAPGGFNDPGPATIAVRDHGSSQISLQTVFSVFRNEPGFYDAATYSICVPLLLLWVAGVWRSRPSPERDWLALAAIAALSMLPIYHRQNDTRLLLVAIPGCAILWAERGIVGWLASLISAAGVILTGDTPLQLLAILAGDLHGSIATLPGQVVTVLLARPAPLILLVLGVFYLSVYLRRSFMKAAPADSKNAASETSQPIRSAG
jgi:hypothetical protein